MARGSSLSDPKVINELNQNYIAINDNITLLGWPNMPALAPWKRWFDRHSESDGVHRQGFTTSVAVTPDGKTVLGTSGSGYVSELATSVCYSPEKYYAFLQTAEQRYKRIKEISSLPPAKQSLEMIRLKMEVLQETAARNKGSN
jgi:hypothetical protein